jgi:hypothetical protein
MNNLLTYSGPQEKSNVVQLVQPVWGSGKRLFEKEWLMTLEVEVPLLAFPSLTLSDLREQLWRYCRLLSTVVTYFPEGSYCVGRDGVMRLLGQEEFLQSQLVVERQVAVVIHPDELGYAGVTAEKIRESRPILRDDRLKNCVRLIDVYGSMKKRGSGETDWMMCMVRFAVRDGKVIVENLI